MHVCASEAVEYPYLAFCFLVFGFGIRLSHCRVFLSRISIYITKLLILTFFCLCFAYVLKNNAGCSAPYLQKRDHGATNCKTKSPISSLGCLCAAAQSVHAVFVCIV